MPGNVQFNNKGCVDLNSVKSIGNNIQFNNKGYVDLDSVKSIGNNIQFNNGDFVYLGSLKSIPINIDTEVIFPKCLDIYIERVWINNIPFSDSRWTSVEGKVQMYESWVKNNY